MDIAVVIGVRPHYVKAAGLSTLFRENHINAIFIDVQQHYDSNLRDIYINSADLNLRNIECSHDTGSLEDFTSQIINIGTWLESKEGKETKAVIVLGDANPAMTGAIASNRLGIPIIHIEAGVRRIVSEKEHWNSIVADHLSDLRFCYTENSLNNLKREGLGLGSYYVGDVLAEWTLDKARTINVNQYDGINYCLVSIHRPQNCNMEAVCSLCSALETLNKKIIWIIHPRTAPYINCIQNMLDVELIDSRNHNAALGLLKYSDLIVTDSGGFVREGILLSRPVVVCHEQGMWEELVKNNIIMRADMSESSLISAFANVERTNYLSGKSFFIKEDGKKLFIDILSGYLNKIQMVQK